MKQPDRKDMFRYILIVLVILLLLVSTYLLIHNLRQSYRLQKQESELEALNIYVQTLNEKLKSYELGTEQGVTIPKTLQIRELLDSYLKHRDTQHPGLDSNINTEELREDLENFQLRHRFIPNLIPVKDKYIISKSFTENHQGIDFAAQMGAEVVAAASGVIKSVYEDKYFGNVIVIDHLNHHLTFYAHLARTFYQEGYFVEKGQTIGLVGSSGFSKYPHLHFEIFYRGENINPEEINQQ